MFHRKKEGKAPEFSSEVSAEMEKNDSSSDSEGVPGTEAASVSKGPKKQGKLKKLWKKRKKLIIVVVLVAAAAVFWGVKSLSGGEEAALMVTTAQVDQQTVSEVVSIKGTVEGSETAELTSILNSKIISINVKEGDHVSKGQVLAVLDGTDQQEALSKARSEYEQEQLALQDSLKSSQEEYDAAVRARDEAKRTYDTNKQLFDTGAISKEDLLKSQNEYSNTQAKVDGYNVSNGRVVASGSQSKALEIRKEDLNTRSKDLEDIYIKSPIDGTVTRVNAKLGRNASDTENKQAMFVVENLDQLQMNVKISEYDISKIQLGQKVTITSDVLGGETAEGVVSQISPTGEQKDSNGKEMVIPVKIEITNDGGKLMAGVTGNAEILIEQSENALAVPVDALQQDPETGENFVMILDQGNKLKKVPIKIGVESDFYAEVTGGELKAGDQVVMNPDFNMTEGMTVTPIPQEGEQ